MKTIFKQRRERLLSTLNEGDIVLIPNAPEVYRNGDTHYPYRPNSSFYYLTGFAEPEAVLVLNPGGATGEYLLFNRSKDPSQEVWTGARVGQEGAVATYGCDRAFPIDSLAKELLTLLKNKKRVHYLFNTHTAFEKLLHTTHLELSQQTRAGVTAPSEWVDIHPRIAEMRLIKDEHEIKLMRQAAKISVEAHQAAKAACAPGRYEYEIEAELLKVFYQHGARQTAYEPIVAGGANACTLHYVANQSRLNAGDLLLIDAGAEFQYYAADITRTFPVNGQFTPTQQALYDLVQHAQTAAIQLLKPGLPFNVPHEQVIQIFTQGLKDLGLLKGSIEELLEKEAYKQFYMHRLSHWLGMDVHDVGAYQQEGHSRLLEAGMVLTVEPGLYIAAEDTRVSPEWRGIGIRIEDDVLVTLTGHEILSQMESLAAIP